MNEPIKLTDRPTPETDAFMTLIDDSEIDLGLVEAKLSDMESQRDEARERARRLREAFKEIRPSIKELSDQIICPKDNTFSRQLAMIDAILDETKEAE